MKNKLFIIVLTLSVISTFSQTKFEKAYFVYNTGERIECLIRNMDWEHNPTKFDYRDNEDAKTKTGDIKGVKEFGIYNYSIYKRFTVDIDRSSDLVSKLELDRRPKFLKETLFLKVLEEGKANLYSYIDSGGGIIRFFYSIDNSEVTQLIYKRYLAKNADDILKNERYKQQLQIFLECSVISTKHLEKTDYNSYDLIDLFLAYNNFNNHELGDYKKAISNNSLDFSVLLGRRWAIFDFNDADEFLLGLPRSANITYGVEMEYIFRFEKYEKYSFFVQPTFQPSSFETHGYSVVDNQEYFVSIQYKSIEVPFGSRFFLNATKNFNSFIEMAGVVDFPITAKLFIEPSGYHKANANVNLSFAIGVQYKDNYRLRLNLGKRSMFKNASKGPIQYRYGVVALSYRIFNK